MEMSSEKRLSQLCVYVPIEVALCGVPMELGVRLGLGEVQCPNPAVTICPASRTLVCVLTLDSVFGANFNLGS